MKIISISINNAMKEINIKNTNINTQLNNLTNTQGNGELELIYCWNYNNNIIKCYSWIDGDESLINKHQLCKSGISEITDIVSENIKLYGNIYILSFNNNKLIDYNISEYGEFYFLINDIENMEDSSDSESINSDIITNNKDENINNDEDEDEDEKIIDDFDFNDINYDYKENVKVNKNKIKQIDNITKFKKKENIITNELNYDNNKYENI